MGDYRRAEEHAACASRLVESLFAGEDEASPDRASWSARLHNLLGHIAARHGSVETAESEFGAGVALYRRAGDLAGLSQAFNNLGLVAKNRCQWSRAREYLTVSERLRSEGEEASPHGGSLQNLGIVHLKARRVEQGGGLLRAQPGAPPCAAATRRTRCARTSPSATSSA